MSAVAGISQRTAFKRKMRSSKSPLVLPASDSCPPFAPGVLDPGVLAGVDNQTEGGGFLLKPLKALIAFEMRELFEDVWLVPPADARLEEARFFGRGICQLASELAREAGAGPSSTVTTHGSAAESEMPIEASEGVTSQGSAVNSWSAQASAGFASAGLYRCAMTTGSAGGSEGPGSEGG